MCTGLTLITKDGKHLFGRNMDIEFEFGQSVGVIPRNFEYENRMINTKEHTKYGIIGMMTIMENHPMLADGMNEEGLGIAGLNFPGYAYYEPEIDENKENVSVYDFMFWILANFKDLYEVREALNNVNIMDKPFNEKTPIPTLHWIITDKSGKSIVVEKSKQAGLKVFENNLGVLTNSPTFDWHETNLRQYIGLYANQAGETKWSEQSLPALGQGAGCVGLPGDFTPASRFVRVAFLRHNALANDSESMDINEFFHILNNVAMVRGTVRTPQQLSDITVYTSCMNLEDKIYFYNTYKNNSLNAVDMKKVDLNGKEIVLFPYENELKVNYQN
ncbi:choloylglycine hydrolase [uncultured Clostridium sp.]|uniref:choloylglycine hydrolase n=1 Tax=uncultured Clostridium sp. TaxID=59620 RepID=UPI0026032301|nr:choloylglycine hydrolase [uncultured Clostridium sp.]